MPERFFAPVDLSCGAVRLDESESRHAIAVLRLKPGDVVVAFDGRGNEATARVAAVSRRHVDLEVIAVRSDEREPVVPPLVLATAFPKGDRIRWLVEKATELGVDRLIPLQTERSVVDPREGKLDKLRQTVVAACKQCGRNRLMEIAPVTAWNAVVSAYGSAGSAVERDGATPTRLIVAHPGGTPWREAVESLPPGATVCVAIGPEGGFTSAEIDLATGAGCRGQALGPLLLRVETAAVAAAALRLTRQSPSNPVGQMG